MKRVCVAVLLQAVMLAAAVPQAEGASKYKPCSLLTAAEIEAVLGAKVTGSSERDVPIKEGPYKGETHSMCTWSAVVAGPGGRPIGIMLFVSPGPRTPEERAAADATTKKVWDDMKQKGWTLTQTKIGSAACVRMVPPASEPTGAGAICGVESKGLALSVNVFSPTVTVQQVKALLDKAVARLP